MFKRSKHNNLSVFKISQNYCELLKLTIRASEKVYHNRKPNNFRDVQNIYQDKASIDMTLYQFKLLTSTCLNKKLSTSTN